ncbi:aldehyde dehydrogenase [Rhodococcus pseudokoreensis]|uniref:aldehyde dehydrogenase (NAD(+)) n=1 Tax=Rhodococcus pseudokoreensis TaxID=2811421 RepID=A0A974W831_9NOCA|nr:aldehyde dehydrogenase [Rhodococcus pseudokoreensis]QSE93008.1 aldehyde dehydrogenase [Rhodococcus pseudokoreensis]
MWHGQFQKLFIDGEWVAPSGNQQIEVVSPFTEQVVERVAAATRTDIDRAATAAREAFDRGPWPRVPLAERVEVLTRFSKLYAQHEDLMAELVTAEMGCPIQVSRKIQAGAARQKIESFLELAQEYPFEAIRESSSGRALVSRQPVGVVAAIVPWNVPQAITMLKLMPALLAGCTLVLKPAPEAPLDAYLVAELLTEAGLPRGVVNVVPADREASEALVTHPAVDKVSFTGSTAAGRRIASLCGNDLRRVTLELGGKSAAIILDDADLDAAVESLRFGSLRNTGQVCSAKSRILVSRKRQAELVDRLTAMIAAMPVGDPMSEATELGPLVSARQRERVEEYFEIGRSEGAKIVLGGGRPGNTDRGWFVDATVFTEVESSMRIAQEEIFGPVLSVIAYDDEAQAIDISNDSRYGLNGSVFTTDVDHGLAVARRLRTGTVELNGSRAGSRAPAGGFKSSGIGREGAIEGFDSYVEVQSIGLPPGFVYDAAHEHKQ